MRIRLKNLFVVLLAVSLGSGALYASSNEKARTEASEDYDVVILNGRVMDPETKTDKVLNVGIEDGIIKTLTNEKIKGKETINAKGLVVAPGFIDSHVHSNTKLGTKMKMTLRHFEWIWFGRHRIAAAPLTGPFRPIASCSPRGIGAAMILNPITC